MRPYKYSSCWDAKVQELLGTEEFSLTRDRGEYTVRLGGTVLWIANCPYASITSRSQSIRPVIVMPSRRTVFEFFDKYNEWLEDQ